MSQFASLEMIIKRIKEIEDISTDKEVAKLIGVSPQSLSNSKKKESIPHKGITKYCLEYCVDINELIHKRYPGFFYKYDREFLNKRYPKVFL